MKKCADWIMDFYYNDISAPCRGVMLTAKALGITLNKKYLDLMKGEQRTPEYIAINPQHCIPTLVDGGIPFWESRAISTYLISKYGEDDSLYPADPKERAIVDRLLYFDMGTLYQIFANYAYPILFFESTNKPDPEELKKLHEALGLLNGFLEGQEFAAGDQITVADFFLIATVSTIIESGIDLSEHSNVLSWVERCKSQMVGYDTENDYGAKQFGIFAKDKLTASL